MPKMRFKFSLPNKDTALSWGICVLAVVCVILASLVYSKVQKEGYNAPSKLGIKARTPPAIGGKVSSPPADWVSSCRQAFNNAGYNPSCQTSDPSGVECSDYPIYYCNGSGVDVTGDPNGGGACYKHYNNPNWPGLVAYKPEDCSNPSTALKGSLCGGPGAENCKGYCGGLQVQDAPENPWGYKKMCVDGTVAPPAPPSDPVPPEGAVLKYPPSKFVYCGGSGVSCSSMCNIRKTVEEQVLDRNGKPILNQDGNPIFTTTTKDIPTEVYPAPDNDYGFQGICEKGTSESSGVYKPGVLCSQTGTENCDNMCGSLPITSAPPNPWGYDRLCDIPFATGEDAMNPLPSKGDNSKWSFCGGPNAKSCVALCGSRPVYDVKKDNKGNIINPWGATGICEVPKDIPTVKAVLKSATEDDSNHKNLMYTLKIVVLVFALIVCIMFLMQHLRMDRGDSSDE